MCSSASAQTAPLPEAGHRTIEYHSVAEALAALRAKPDAELSEQGGWTIAVEPAKHAMWSFAPAGHPAYPAVVKRTVVYSGGATSIKTDVLCEATKDACDGLVRAFIELDEKMRASIQHQGETR